jgi:DNA-binding SARP family transcriptional activator
VTCPWLDAMRQTLEHQRVTALLDRNDIRLRLGEHSPLLSDLTALAEAHPSNERLVGQLMLALYRSGQQAGALRSFETLRRRLADEYGTRPRTCFALSAHLLTTSLRDCGVVAGAPQTGLRCGWLHRGCGPGVACPG